jgi:hypothetical protein
MVVAVLLLGMALLVFFASGIPVAGKLGKALTASREAMVPLPPDGRLTKDFLEQL